jgi:hypothetical protein
MATIVGFSGFSSRSLQWATANGQRKTDNERRAEGDHPKAPASLSASHSS